MKTEGKAEKTGMNIYTAIALFNNNSENRIIYPLQGETAN